MNTSTSIPTTPETGAGPSMHPDDRSAAEATAHDVEVEELTATGFRNFQRYTHWSLLSAALALLVLPAIVGPTPYPPDPLGTASFVTVVVTAAAIARLTGHHIPPRPGAPSLGPKRWWTWVVIGTIASVALASIWIAADDHFLWSFGPAMIASLVVVSFPRRWRTTSVLVGMVIAAAVGAAIGDLVGEPRPATAITAALVTGFAMMLTLATVWSWRIVVQLHDAKQTAATLAVANERLRFAADLHDIQGHNLQVIALKSELAHRLLPRDPDGAAREIADVQSLAADALRDTRAVVQGYRRATVDAEITNATAVLGSAGIETRLNITPHQRLQEGDLGLSSESRHLLGLVVREAVTNVIRHSTATRASIDLDQDDTVTLTITNDGAEATRGSAAAGDADAAGSLDEGAAAGAPGGLADLAERLRTVGGDLRWRCEDDRFEVRARLPTADAP